MNHQIAEAPGRQTIPALITSYGARWQDPPPLEGAAALAIDLRNVLWNPPDDPAAHDEIIRQTGLHTAVSDYVLSSPGALHVVQDAGRKMLALLQDSVPGRTRPVHLLVNCQYGRHRAPAIAEAVAQWLRERGTAVAVQHRHINKPLIPRKHPRPHCPFCQIVHGQVPATIVREWDDTIAILPRSGGVTEGHTLIIPRSHVDDITVDPVVSATTMLRAAELAAEGGDCNVIASRGPAGTQTVLHLHLHLVPRTQGDGLTLPWTPPQPRYEVAS